MNLVDGIFFIVLAWGAFRGFSRGLISMVCGVAGILAGVWAAGRYYIPVAAFLENRLGLEGLFAKILIPFCAGGSSAGGGAQFALDAGSAFPPSLWAPVEAMQNGMSGATSAQLMADSLVKIIAFFLVFAVVSKILGVCLDLLAKLLTGIANVVLMGGVNRIGGLALGLASSGLLLIVTVGMLTPFLYSLSLGFFSEGFSTALIDNWELSVMVPYFHNSWEVAAQVLANLFHMV